MNRTLFELIPLTRFLGSSVADAEFEAYLLKFGAKPKLKVVSQTASIEYKKHGFAFGLKERGFMEGHNAPPRGSERTKLIVTAVFLYSNGYEGFKQYQGPLPEYMQFFDDRLIVKVKLGEPYRSREERKGPANIVWPAWDQYRFDTCAMTVEYRENKATLVTFWTLQEADALESDGKP